MECHLYAQTLFLRDTELEENLFFLHVAFHDDEQNVPAVVMMTKVLQSSCLAEDLFNVQVVPVVHFIS